MITIEFFVEDDMVDIIETFGANPGVTIAIVAFFVMVLIAVIAAVVAAISSVAAVTAQDKDEE